MIRELIARIRGWFFSLRCNLFSKRTRIGKGLKIYRKLEIKGKGRCIIGNDCSAKGMPGCKDQYVTISTSHPDALVKVGNNVELLAAKMTCKFAIVIGNDALIEDAALMDSDFHSIDKPRRDAVGESKEACMIVIEDGVAIGARSVVGKGARIGVDSIVVPNSVVRGIFPPASFIIGNPARRVSRDRS